MRGVRRDGAAFVRRARGDRLRLVLAVGLLVVALPWLAAEIGFYFPGDLFMGEEIPAVRDEGLAAVHVGFHHGMGGVVLALIALLLSACPAGAALRGLPVAACSRTASRTRSRTRWNEQLWKRGWVGSARSRA